MNVTNAAFSKSVICNYRQRDRLEEAKQDSFCLLLLVEIRLANQYYYSLVVV
jgi:hypothetical protein